MWLKVDDGMPQHPKVVAAAARLGANGLGRVLAVWVEAMCYCNRHLTDGLVTNDVAATLKSDKNPIEILRVFAQKSVRLAHRTRDGWQMHDYHEYQPSKAEVEKKRKKERDRKRRVRGKSARTTSNVRHVSARTTPERPHAVRAASADPDPIRTVPTPEDQKPDQEHRADARDSLAVLKVLAYEAVDELGLVGPHDSTRALEDRLKDKAAEKRIPYRSGEIATAVEQALHQRRRAS